jgi:hypothetical protein
MGKTYAAIAFIAGLAPAVALADPHAYLCIADQATGFKYDKNLKEWKLAIFHTNNERYILKLKDNQWYWSEFGNPSHEPPQCDQFNSSGNIKCVLTIDEDIMEIVSFNRNTLRYQFTYVFGYVDPLPMYEGSDTPSIEIGRCSEM